MRALPYHTSRAGDGARTRDIKLGRLALYQLSYSRNKSPEPRIVLICTHQLIHFYESRSMVGEGFEPSKA